MAETALLSEPSDLDLDLAVGIGLTDLEKSAVVMLSIGEDAAAEVMKHLTQLEINQLSLAMARVSNVSKGEVTEVFQQFIDAMLDESSIGIGSSSYVQGSSSGRSAPTRPSASSLALVRATILPASKQSRCRIPAFSRR